MAAHTSTPSTKRLSEANTSYKVKTKNVLGIAETCTNSAPNIKKIHSNQLIVGQTHTLSLGFFLNQMHLWFAVLLCF